MLVLLGQYQTMEYSNTSYPGYGDMDTLVVYETARRHSCTAMACCSTRVSLQGLSLYTVLTMWSIA